MKNGFLKIVFLLALAYGTKNCFSQTSQTDSLQQVLKTAKEDTNKVNALNQLSKQLCLQGYDDSALVFSHAAKLLGEKLNFKKGVAQACTNTGTAYQDLGDDKSALKHYNDALKLWEELGDKTGIGNMYFRLALIYAGEGNFEDALKNHLAALRLRKESGDKKAVGNSYNNLGLLYHGQGIYPEALKNHLSALKTREEIDDKKGIAGSYNNIGNVYADQGNYSNALKNYTAALTIYESMGNRPSTASSFINIGSIYYDKGNFDEALKNYLAALNIQEELDDQEGLTYSYTGIGLVYTDKGNYEEALKNHLAALKIREKLDDKFGMANSYVNLCVTYKALKNYREAEAYGLKALTLSKELGFLDGIKSSNQSLSEVYALTGRPQQALDAYKAYIIVKDSLLNEANTQKTVQSQMLYEFDKKESAAKLLQEKKEAVTASEKRKQQIVTIAVSIVLILVLGLAAAIWRSLRINQKKNKIIEQQKQLVEHQKHIVEEKHKEITDSINYAERIQRSFLATKELLDQNLQEYFVFFKPKDIVSGDFYWAAEVSGSGFKVPVYENREQETRNRKLFYLATADSTGHGVPGAIMSLLNITSLEKAIEHNSNPAEILNHTRNTIIERLKKDGSADGGKDGMDCSLMLFDFANQKLQVAAANNPVWIVRSTVTSSACEGGVSRSDTKGSRYEQSSTRTDMHLIDIKPDKMPVGKHDRDQEPFTLHTIDLQKGDVIYTLTDGFPDQFGGPKGKKFMSKNLKELLLANAHLPMSSQKQLLEKTFHDWVNGLEHVDDVTIIGIRV